MKEPGSDKTNTGCPILKRPSGPFRVGYEEEVRAPHLDSEIWDHDQFSTPQPETYPPPQPPAPKPRPDPLPLQPANSTQGSCGSSPHPLPILRNHQTPSPSP